MRKTEKNTIKIKTNKVKNIEASVGAVLTQGKKEIKEGVVVDEIEEDSHQMRNEMVFFLKEAPEYRISAVAEWCENSRGDILTAEPDIYFRHVRTGARCESVWLCFTGWSEPGEEMEKWDTLCERIEEFENLEQTICDEKSVEV